MVSGSFKPIEELVKGSPVIGSDGNCHPAVGVMSRDYDGRLVKIKATGVIDFEPTENHPVLVADIGWKTINTSIPRRNVRLIRSIDWKKSQDVKRGDWLAVPKLKGFRDDSHFDLAPHFIGNRWSISEKIRDGKFPLNEDTAWLMGYYCAEGSSCVKGGGVSFAMHRKEEKTLGARVRSIVNQWIGSRCYASHRREEDGMVVGFGSVLLARMFKDKIGKNASTKRIPDEIFWHRDDRIVKAFLRGYFDGDGTTKSTLFTCATVSKVLAFQVQALFARFGVWMPMVLDRLSLREAKVIVKGPPRKLKDQYKLMSGSDESRMLLGYDPVKEKNRKTKHYTSNDDFIFVRVKSVSSRPWKGRVYNLTSPTEDYLVNNVVVHNCSSHLTLHFDDKIRGNVACVPADTMILGCNQSIDRCQVAFPVLGRDGQDEVSQTFVRDYNGPMLTVKANCMLPFDVTPEHPLLAVPFKVTSVGKREAKTTKKVFGKMEYLAAKDMVVEKFLSGVKKSGHMLVVPKLRGNSDTKHIDLASYRVDPRSSHATFGNLKAKNFLLDEEAAWVLGLYVAEGSAGGKTSITFSLHRKEMDKAKRVVCFFSSRYGLTPRIHDATTPNCISVKVVSPIFMRAFADWFGSGAKNKHVPLWLMLHQDLEIVKSFLKGIFDGDGCYCRRHSRRIVSISTTSKLLALQAQLMFVRLGALPGLSCRKVKAGRKIRGRSLPALELYTLQSEHDSCLSVLGYPGGTKKNFFHDAGDYILVPISYVDSRPFVGKVYNIATGNHNYLVSNVVTHNCDLAVNSHLLANQIHESWPTAESYGFPKGKAAVWYYNNLKDNAKFQQQLKSGAFGVGGVMEWLGKSHRGWDELEKDPVAKEFVKDILCKAKELCNNNYGNIPSDIVEMIEEMLKRERPVIPWNHVLRMFCASATESVLEYTMRRESKRYGTRPGTRKGDVLNLAICLDTSGSISPEQLKLFFNEVRWIWKNGAIVSIVEADCAVARGPYKYNGKWNGEVHGRGGTDLEPALALVEGKYDACIYFTDFYAPPVSRVYRIPTLWVLTTELEKSQYPVQWGRHIKIESGHAVAG
jgi:intein/homing endonuclease